jgi:ATP synthase protein I
MPERSRGNHRRSEQELSRRVSDKERRRRRARRRSSVWFGLGTFGMVGWSVAVPTLLAILIGVWIDSNLPSPFSWTLMLLFVGIVLGCLNAWHWIERERRAIEEESVDDE